MSCRRPGFLSRASRRPGLCRRVDDLDAVLDLEIPEVRQHDLSASPPGSSLVSAQVGELGGIDPLGPSAGSSLVLAATDALTTAGSTRTAVWVDDPLGFSQSHDVCSPYARGASASKNHLGGPVVRIRR